MAILDTDLLLVNRPGDDATYKTTFATLKDNLPAGTIVSENPPGEDVVEQGLLWFDSSIASLFIWYDDGDTAQWVDVYAGAVSGLEIPPPVTVGANPPSGAAEGDLWWDTNKGELYVYYIDSDSEQWVAASPGGIYDGDGSGGGGATVIVGETAPTTRPDGTDLVEGDLWWNNDSTENGGGRMFVYYSNNWVDTSLPGGGGGGGDFSQAEADTLYLSKAAAGDTAKGEITFEKRTNHEGGVFLRGNTSNVQSVNFISTSPNAIFRGAITDSDNAALKIAPYNAADTTDICGIQVGQGSSQAFTRNGTYAGIRALDFSTNIAGRTNIGIESNLTTSSDGTNYNFYAGGSAPNYFKGNIHIGDSATENPKDATTGFLQRLGGGTFSIINSNTGPNNPCLWLNRAGVADDTGHYIRFGLAGDYSTNAGIRGDGSGGVAYNDGSDYRLKENIVELSSTVEAIKLLKPIEYNYTTHPGKTRQGFIAHELSEICPFAVTGAKDEEELIGTLADYDGTELETDVVEPDDLTYTEEVETDGVATMVTRTRSWTATGSRPVYQGVDQTKLIPLLTKALQEALERIETLEADVATLQGN